VHSNDRKFGLKTVVDKKREVNYDPNETHLGRHDCVGLRFETLEFTHLKVLASIPLDANFNRLV